MQVPKGHESWGFTFPLLYFQCLEKGLADINVWMYIYWMNKLMIDDSEHHKPLYKQVK